MVVHVQILCIPKDGIKLYIYIIMHNYILIIIIIIIIIILLTNKLIIRLNNKYSNNNTIIETIINYVYDTENDWNIAMNGIDLKYYINFAFHYKLLNSY